MAALNEPSTNFTGVRFYAASAEKIFNYEKMDVHSAQIPSPDASAFLVCFHRLFLGGTRAFGHGAPATPVRDFAEMVRLEVCFD